MCRPAAYAGRFPNPVFVVEIIWFLKLGQMTPLAPCARAHANTTRHTTSLVACNPTRATFLFHHVADNKRRGRDVTHTWSRPVVLLYVSVSLLSCVLPGGNLSACSDPDGTLAANFAKHWEFKITTQKICTFSKSWNQPGKFKNRPTTCFLSSTDWQVSERRKKTVVWRS